MVSQDFTHTIDIIHKMHLQNAKKLPLGVQETGTGATALRGQLCPYLPLKGAY